MHRKITINFKLIIFNLLFIFGGILSYLAMLDSPHTERVEIFLKAFTIFGFAVFYNFVCNGCYEIVKYFIEKDREVN